MTFIGTGVGIGQIVTFLSTQILGFFLVLDAVQFGDAPYSLLDILISIAFFEMILTFVDTFIHTHKEEGETMSDGVDSAGLTTEVGVNAVESEIDFSTEIVRE